MLLDRLVVLWIALAIEIVDGLADCARNLAGSILDGADGLISHALIGQVGVAGDAANAFFNLAGIIWP